jgi:succinate dehydrogenase/fumarate reductase flavoprotein subunit
MSYVFARYFDAAGRELPIPPGPGNTPALARALLQGPVFCTLERMPQDLREALPTISPNVMLPFTRKGIDPFTQRFEVTLRAEGTVRGIGGLRVASDDCETTVANLFVAGDTASREPVTGAISGGGNVNSAWALSSGLWSGRAAALRTRRDGRRSHEPARAAGQAALRPLRHAAPVDRGAAVAAVQRALLDYDRNIFRDAAGLGDSLLHLEAAWRDVSEHAEGGTGSVTEQLRLRETAALLANARWSVSAALKREESRGMHRRTDAPATLPEFAHRIAVGGLQQLWHRADAVPAPTTSPALEATA